MSDAELDGGTIKLGNGGRKAAIEDCEAVDLHGRAALLLVESLIHALVEKAVLTRGESIEIVDIAADVEAEFALAEWSPGSPMRDLQLASIARTFRL